MILIFLWRGVQDTNSVLYKNLGINFTLWSITLLAFLFRMQNYFMLSIGNNTEHVSPSGEKQKNICWRLGGIAKTVIVFLHWNKSGMAFRHLNSLIFALLLLWFLLPFYLKSNPQKSKLNKGACGNIRA